MTHEIRSQPALNLDSTPAVYSLAGTQLHAQQAVALICKSPTGSTELGPDSSLCSEYRTSSTCRPTQRLLSHVLNGKQEALAFLVLRLQRTVHSISRRLLYNTNLRLAALFLRNVDTWQPIPLNTSELATTPSYTPEMPHATKHAERPNTVRAGRTRRMCAPSFGCGLHAPS